jgi:hypothetical protein
MRLSQKAMAFGFQRQRTWNSGFCTWAKSMASRASLSLRLSPLMREVNP